MLNSAPTHSSATRTSAIGIGFRQLAPSDPTPTVPSKPRHIMRLHRRQHHVIAELCGRASASPMPATAVSSPSSLLISKSLTELSGIVRTISASCSSSHWPRGLHDTVEPTQSYLDEVIAWARAAHTACCRSRAARPGMNARRSGKTTFSTVGHRVRPPWLSGPASDRTHRRNRWQARRCRSAQSGAACNSSRQLAQRDVLSEPRTCFSVSNLVPWSRARWRISVD